MVNPLCIQSEWSYPGGANRSYICSLPMNHGHRERIHAIKSGFGNEFRNEREGDQNRDWSDCRVHVNSTKQTKGLHKPILGRPKLAAIS